MSDEQMQTAESIVSAWFWQPESWHLRSFVRYYESSPLQPDVLALVMSYLKQQQTEELYVLGKRIQFGEEWKATNVWLRTSPTDKWAGTESTKIRIYQALRPAADVDLLADHELSALEHRDVKQRMLPDGSQEEPEPDELVIEDTDAEIKPLPVLSPQTKPEGFADLEDQAGGLGRKLLQKRVVVNDETGQRELQEIERTSIPYKKKLSWIDYDSAHEMLVFLNQKTVPTVKTTIVVNGASVAPTNTSISLAINEFGLFSGTYHYTCGKSGSGSSDVWGTWHKKITIKERVVKPGGRVYIKTYEVTKYVYHGSPSGANDHYLNGTEYPHLGLHAFRQVGLTSGDAYWYGNDLVLKSEEPETVQNT